MIERIILTAEAEPTGPSWIVGRHAERGERGGPVARMRAADEQRRTVKARVDGRHDGHVDVTRPRRVDLFRRSLFRLRCAGVAVEKEPAFAEARGSPRPPPRAPDRR